MTSPQEPERTLLTYRRPHSLDDSSLVPHSSSTWLVAPPLPGYQPVSSVGTSRSATIVPENSSSLTALAAVRRSPSQRVRRTILDRLHQLLPQVLDHLANPTFASAAKACSLLLTPKQPSLKQSTRMTSTKKQRQLQKQAPKKTDISPPKSPRILQWLSSAQNQQQSSNSSNIANRETTIRRQQEDDEWERLVVTPFLLLLGAEAWVADHGPQQDPSSSWSFLLLVQGLYQRARQDVWNTQHVLQHPGKRGGDEDLITRAVHQSLEGVLHWISARCQVLQILECPVIQQQAEAFQVLSEKSRILSSSSSMDEWGSAQPLIRALRHEVLVYRAACDACCAVQQARFLDSIILMRRWKSSLPRQVEASSTTRRDQWLRHSYQHALSLLPMYFDRSRAMAGPLYGLRAMNQILENNLDILVLEFLKRQERLGGPPTAVALVLDAAGTSNFHPERGFCLNAGLDEEKEAVGESESKHRVLWPAIYLRSTLHSGVAYHSTTTSTPQRTGNPSSSNSRLSYKSAGSLVRATNRSSGVAKNRTAAVSSTTILLEYGPDGGTAKSWPHSKWHALATILDRQKATCRQTEHLGTSPSQPLISQVVTRKKLIEAIPVTYRLAPDMSPSESQSQDGPDSVATLFTQPQSLEMNSPVVNTDSLHLIAVSEWITLVVMVKKEEGGRWQRRRSQIHDEEIHQFLTSMAEQLSVNDLLRSEYPPELSTADPLTEEVHLPFPTRDDFSWINDSHVADFVADVKAALGSRPSTSVQAQDTTKGIKGCKTTAESSQEVTAWAVAMTDSAATFFLGPALSRALNDQTDQTTTV